MSDETLRTLITCGTTILVALISNILVFAMSKLNNKKVKENSFIQQQYEKLYMPIHKILFFDELSHQDRFTQVYNIINNNYPLTNSLLRDTFCKCISKNSITTDFETVILTGCMSLESILGLKKTKTNKKQKELFYGLSILSIKES